MKEFFRKRIVALKKRPQTIPLLFLVLSCVVFTFNLSSHSTTVIRLKDTSIAIFMFAVTLMSFMCIVSFLPVKKLNKKAIVPIVITGAMLVAQIALQINYLMVISSEVANNGVEISDYLAHSRLWTIIHVVFLCISSLAVATMPLIKKLLLKINTTKKEQDWDNSQLEQLDLEQLV